VSEPKPKSEPEPVPPAVRVQMLATEHWSLLATRGQTWSEVMSRIMAQFTFTSAALVVLALVVQQTGYDDGSFRALALGLGAAVILTGTLTSMRVHYASHEDAQLVRGLNRLRHAYVEIDPSIAPYFVAGIHDDVAGLNTTYTMGPNRTATQLLASASLFITIITALVTGGWVGILASPLGTAAAVAFGVVGGLAYVAAFLTAGYRLFVRYEAIPGHVLFPTPPPDDPSGQQSGHGDA
jgi:hypothetical protein